MRSCRLCGGDESKLVQIGVRYLPTAEVRQCLGCDLVFLWPQPSSSDLASYYQRGYVEEYDVPPPLTRHRRDRQEAQERVARLSPLLVEKTRILEVGSGSGAFLDAVKPFVSEAAAVEPNTECRAFIRDELGVTVWSTLEEARAEELGTFDVVVAFHVLEHARDPIHFLGQLASFLMPASGRLVIEVPNVDDALLALYECSKYAAFYYQRAHLHYFSPATLSAVFVRAGYQANIRGVQRYDLTNHLYWLCVGRPGGQGFHADVLGHAVCTAYAEALIEANLCDTLWAVARACDGDHG